jgi:glycosyltransferase involved in cell wall biosynthesis
VVVLYVVFKCFVGGHVLSAFTVANRIKDNEFSVIFSGAYGEMVDDIKKCMPFESVEIPIFYKDRQSYFGTNSIAAIVNIRKIIKKYHVNLIHAFDARSYMHAYPAGLIESVPTVCTLCGGIDPYYNLPISPIIMVFSEEQREKMINQYRWPEFNVQVVRTRIDLVLMHDKCNFFSDEEADYYGISLNLPKLMMISSFDNTKILSIHRLLDVVEILFKQGVLFQLVLIGGKGELFLQAQQRGKSICAQYGANLIKFTGPINQAFRLLQRADIVLGVGRSAFEGMAYGKPTLIIGENGFAGAVCEKMIDKIAWYNFSGRNQTTDDSGSLLETEIIKLLGDVDYRRQLGEFGKNFVFREIDVAHGVDRIINIYRQITSDYKPSHRWSQGLSFVKCLLPILRDNSLHSTKVRLKPLVQIVKNKLFEKSLKCL